jgi:hypothetical protein
MPSPAITAIRNVLDKFDDFPLGRTTAAVALNAPTANNVTSPLRFFGDSEPSASPADAAGARGHLNQQFSIASAMPMPPLTHNVASPLRTLRRRISWSSVTTMRVPVQPIG